MVCLDRRAGYVEQIMRDLQTLKLDDELIAPSRDFYERRIDDYQDAIAAIDAGTVPAADPRIASTTTNQESA